MKNIFNAEGETPMLPVVHNIRNVSYLSGYSPTLLQHLCENGISELENYTPWSAFMSQLHHERYTWKESAILSLKETGHSSEEEINSQKNHIWWW